MKQVLIAQCNGCRIMEASVFELVPYKLLFQYAILPVTRHDVP